VPARKKGKLPGNIIQERYSKWRGGDVLEIQAHAFEEFDNKKGVIIVDDSGKSHFLLPTIILLTNMVRLQFVC